MNSIVLWFDLARRSFRSQSVYRINVLVNLIYSFMSVLINVSVWNALYAQNVDPAATLSEAITYSVISSTFLVGMQLWPGSRIGDAVYSGEVGQQMVRPMNLLAQHAAMELGEKMFNFFTCILPCIVAAKIVYNALLFPATLADVLFFLLSALLGNMIFLLLNTILGYTAFWLGNVWYIQWFLTAAMYVFGGEMVPFWFLPDKLNIITWFMPFRCVLFIPMEMYLGRLSMNQIIFNLCLQVSGFVSFGFKVWISQRMEFSRITSDLFFLTVHIRNRFNIYT